MSELMVIAYSNRTRAAEVIDMVRHLDDGWFDLNDTVAVVRDKKGGLRISQSPVTGARAVPWRALWHRLLQIGAPSSGVPVGASREHRASAAGIPEPFVRAAGAMIEQADSALIIWVRTRMPGRIREQICAAGDDVLQAPLSSEQDALLDSVLDVFGPMYRERA